MGTEEANSERLVLDWSVGDVKELLAKLQSKIPKNDHISFTKRISKLDWEGITVGDYSSAECRAQWDRIVSNLRTFRLLGEILKEAVAWVDDPKSSRRKESEHPEFPKAPLNAYFKYTHQVYGKFKARHPELAVSEIAKKIKKRWDKLPDQEKAEYNATFQAEKERYARLKREFYVHHPEYVRTKIPSEKRKRRSLVEEGPALPKTPFGHYVESRIAIDEPEANKKEQKEALKLKWASMSDKRKSKYIEKAMDDKRRYQDELDAYVAIHPDFVMKKHKNCVTNAEADLLATAYGRPKAPGGRTGYQFFCSEFHQKMNGKGNTTDNLTWMGQASAAWNKLSPERKAEYNTRMKTAWTEYHDACETYLENVPDERKEEEQKILKREPLSSASLTNGTKKRGMKLSADDAQVEPKKRRRKAAPAALTGRSFFILEEQVKLKKQSPGLGEEYLKRLVNQAYEKLPKEQKDLYESKAEQLSKLAG